jgi:hypothetical protein
MNTAEKVIAKFGTQTALAELIGKGQSTVQHWAKTGIIPSQWQGKLLELAKLKGISLSPRDFIVSTDIEIITTPHLPVARWSGVLKISENDELPVYVLDDGRRLISRTGATAMLTDKKGGGNLEQYITIHSIQPYIPSNIIEKMIEFTLPEITNKTVKGITAEDFLSICNAYVQARDLDVLASDRQRDIARKANILLMACAKVGLIALIDEATGYQYERPLDALQVKLKLFLADEIRKWEKTFPDQLWIEFGRLTGWKEPLRERPKYWGKLVTELIYEYLDPDVASWLKEHVPEPRHGQNYFQWLNAQYGLQRLVQHIWMVIGIAKTCNNMNELKEKMGVQFGREPVQLTFYLPPPPPSN